MNLSASTNPFSNLVVKAPFHKICLDLRASYEKRNLALAACSLFKRNCSTRTVYCISPYKTGTTYFAGLFYNDYRVRHEPMHYLSLRSLDDIHFLAQRANYLCLDMECSGFFAGHLSKLRLIFPDSPVIYLKRPPEAWITSVINYFSSLADSINYNYVCRILFDRVCFSHPIDRFFSSDDRERSLILKYLLEYWIRVYEEAVKDPYALIIPLTDVDARIEEIEDFISMRACSGRRIWKRENPKKESIRLSRYIDLSVYKDKLARHGY